MSTERIAIVKRGRGGVGYQQKRCFLKLRMDADRKRLFCSNASTLLSMIVASKIRYEYHRQKFLLVSFCILTTVLNDTEISNTFISFLASTLWQACSCSYHASVQIDLGPGVHFSFCCSGEEQLQSLHTSHISVSQGICNYLTRSKKAHYI